MKDLRQGRLVKKLLLLQCHIASLFLWRMRVKRVQNSLQLQFQGLMIDKSPPAGLMMRGFKERGYIFSQIVSSLEALKSLPLEYNRKTVFLTS